MKILPLLIVPLLCLTGCASVVPGFKKVQLTDQFWAEGADFGDFNRDGIMDVASGPFWYAGPDFKTRHEYRPATNDFTRINAAGVPEKIPGFEGALGVNNAYSDNFFTFVYDFNHDGSPDIM
ncbi:MAG TPA: VCBS repeat-containing protein, partial [Verrucomicrobiae bacterium]|nr:VCBS repeat-containing protein [Verrucomicrobiae bacterium]